MFSDELWNGFFWPDPLPPFSELGLQLGGAAYLATAIAAIYALKVGTWESARVYLAYSFPYIVMAVVVTLITIAEHGGAPIGWLYLLLSAFYLPIVAYTWRRESRAASRAASPEVQVRQ